MKETPAAARLQPFPAGGRCVRYLDLPLWTGRPADIAAWFAERMFASAGPPTIISHINANNYYWLHQRPALRARLARECVLILDGVGLAIGGMLMGLGRLPDLNGTDLFPLVMRHAARRRARIFMLGGHAAVIRAAALRTRDQYPGLDVVGWHSGYFDAGEVPSLVARIRDSGANVLLIGCGFLRQEEFALEHAAALGVPLIWNVGGLFDFVSGAKPRAPRVVRAVRLEWLFRFLIEPQHMWHRNVVAAPWFLGHVVACRSARGGPPRDFRSRRVVIDKAADLESR